MDILPPSSFSVTQRLTQDTLKSFF